MLMILRWRTSPAQNKATYFFEKGWLRAGYKGFVWIHHLMETFFY